MSPNTLEYPHPIMVGTYIAGVDNGWVVSPLIAKLVAVLHHVGQFFTQVRWEVLAKLVPRLVDEFGLEPSGLGEDFDELPGGDPFPIADEVLPGGFFEEGLDERTRVFLGGNVGELHVGADGEDETNHTIFRLRASS